MLNPEILEQFRLKHDPKDEKIKMLEEYNAELILKINLHREQHEQHMITIDDLTRENQSLRDWKDKWEERFNSEN